MYSGSTSHSVKEGDTVLRGKWISWFKMLAIDHLEVFEHVMNRLCQNQSRGNKNVFPGLLCLYLHPYLGIRNETIGQQDRCLLLHYEQLQSCSSFILTWRLVGVYRQLPLAWKDSFSKTYAGNVILNNVLFSPWITFICLTNLHWGPPVSHNKILVFVSSEVHSVVRSTLQKEVHCIVLCSSHQVNRSTLINLKNTHFLYISANLLNQLSVFYLKVPPCCSTTSDYVVAAYHQNVHVSAPWTVYREDEPSAKVTCRVILKPLFLHTALLLGKAAA